MWTWETKIRSGKILSVGQKMRTRWADRWAVGEPQEAGGRLAEGQGKGAMRQKQKRRNKEQGVGRPNKSLR